MSEEYLQLAHAVEKKWTRDQQNEQDLRLRLQENLETMASQIHRLENEAQRSAEGHGQRTLNWGSHDHTPSAVASSGDKEPVSGRGSVGDELAGGGEEEGEGEGEERFFDAHEISAEEWAESIRAEFQGSSTTAVAEGVDGPVTGDRPPFDNMSIEKVSHNIHAHVLHFLCVCCDIRLWLSFLASRL